MSQVPYTINEGEWPILQDATPLPPTVLQSINSQCTGNAISSHIGFLSLGYFYIDVNLLEQHPTQRQISSHHANYLKEDFETRGILRTESPGVVIGLGKGWEKMKNSGPLPLRITTASSYLSHLSLSANGPIAQVIRGGHCTEAIRRLSECKEENYWYYNVLLPSKSTIYFIYLLYNYLLTNTNTFPYEILLDYSCVDNLEKCFMPNSYHRTCLNYTSITNHVYASSRSTTQIKDVVKRHHNITSTTKITLFHHLLKFKDAVPHLVQILVAGGIWTVDCEPAYGALVKCRSEKVSLFSFFFIRKTIS